MALILDFFYHIKVRILAGCLCEQSVLYMLHEFEAFDWFKDCYATQIYVSLDQSKKVAEQMVMHVTSL